MVFISRAPTKSVWRAFLERGCRRAIRVRGIYPAGSGNELPPPPMVALVGLLLVTIASIYKDFPFGMWLAWSPRCVAN